MSRSDDGRWVVYVENLPENISSVNLLSIFTEFGVIGEVFVSNRRNKANKFFGFVKFGKEPDARMAVQNLNGKLVSGNRISVNVARFDKQKNPIPETRSNAKFWLPKDKKSPSTTSGQKRVIWNSLKRPYVSFKDALLSKDAIDEVSVIQDKDLDETIRSKGVINNDFSSWLQYSVLVVTKEEKNINTIQTRLQKMVLIDTKVKRVGERLFLLSFVDGKLFSDMDANFWSPLKSWCLKCIKWSPTLSMLLRVARFSLKGVPWQAWTSETAANVLGRWGEVLWIESDLFKEEVLEELFVVALVDFSQHISGKVWLDLDKFSSLVFFKEVGFVKNECDLQHVPFSRRNSSGARSAMDGFGSFGLEDDKSVDFCIFEKCKMVEAGAKMKACVGSSNAHSIHGLLDSSISAPVNKEISDQNLESDPSVPPGFEPLALNGKINLKFGDSLGVVAGLENNTLSCRESFSPSGKSKKSCNSRGCRSRRWVRPCSSFSSFLLCDKIRSRGKRRGSSSLVPSQGNSSKGRILLRKHKGAASNEGFVESSKSLEVVENSVDSTATRNEDESALAKLIREEAKETWKIGKQLGLSAINEKKTLKDLEHLIRGDLLSKH
ncbi:hypothetical protein REPUB_Repub19eG0085800 [Reevesia pubescens]